MLKDVGKKNISTEEKYMEKNKSAYILEIVVGLHRAYHHTSSLLKQQSSKEDLELISLTIIEHKLRVDELIQHI